VRLFPSEGVSQFSAYPVLIPLYVAQYTPEDPESSNQSLTLFIQAHGTDVSYILYLSDKYLRTTSGMHHDGEEHGPNGTCRGYTSSDKAYRDT